MTSASFDAIFEKARCASWSVPPLSRRRYCGAKRTVLKWNTPSALFNNAASLYEGASIISFPDLSKSSDTSTGKASGDVSMNLVIIELSACRNRN